LNPKERNAFLGCRAKFRRECVFPSSGASVVPPCKVTYDSTTAKEMLLMAPTGEEQQQWVNRLAKRIQKGGYKASGGSTADVSVLSSAGSSSGVRISQQDSVRSAGKPASAASVASASKSSTLPPGSSLPSKK